MSSFTVDIKRADSILPQSKESLEESQEFSRLDAGEVRQAQRVWAGVPVTDKLKLIRRFRHLAARQAGVLADSSASLRNRRQAETLTAEVLPLLEACRFLERQATGLLQPRKPSFWSAPWWLGFTQNIVMREPHGIILIIAPTNYPLFLPTVQALQALVAGNAVWIKPGAGCRNPMLLFQSMLKSSGLPQDLIQILPDSINAVQGALNAGIDKVVLTGSAHTGANVLRSLAPRLIPATMELSGCDAAFIRPDADLEMVTKALVFGQHLNGGATCIAPRRVFVPEELATELEGRLAREFATRATVLLDTDDSQYLRARIQGALKEGAHLVSGQIQPDGSIYGPIVLAERPRQKSNFEHEYFGPIMILTMVKTEEEALELNARSPYALGASVFSKNIPAAKDLARRIDAGVVVINDMIAPTADPRLPFGGRRKSGFGSTRGPEGLLEMTRPKVITTTRGQLRPHLDPHQDHDEMWITDALETFHGHGFLNRITKAIRMARCLTQRSRNQNQHKKDMR